MKLEKYYFCAECGQIIKKVKKTRADGIQLAFCPECGDTVLPLKREIEGLLKQKYRMEEE